MDRGLLGVVCALAVSTARGKCRPLPQPRKQDLHLRETSPGDAGKALSCTMNTSRARVPVLCTAHPQQPAPAEDSWVGHGTTSSTGQASWVPMF